jgi:methylenetetrahydrofolate reductase (NADPH)
MRIADLLQRHGTTFSFEFFPPKSEEAIDALVARATELSRLRPAFVSVTYGAGGSTRQRTRDLVTRLSGEVGLTTAAHLTCVGHSRQDLLELLTFYHAKGIRNIVALRGDAPAAGSFVAHEGGFQYACQLVELIRSRFADHFGIAVAGYPEGHPETPSKLVDLDNLKRKVDAGADAVITQLFFDNRDFYDFRERCELAGIRVPIVAGIMPVLSWSGIQRMAGLCGARIPARLLARLQRAADDEAGVTQIGVDWAVQQCRDLLEHHVRGIHFYTLNRSTATLEIYRRLGASDSEALKTLVGA